MGGLGAPELLIILIIVLLVFGGAKLPQLARSLGEAQREFKKGHESPRAEEPVAPRENTPPPPPPPPA